MPAPPSYIDIVSLPFSRTVTQAEFNGGTFGGVANEVWFRRIATGDEILGLYTNDGGTFVPRMALYASDGTTLHKQVDFAAGWWRYLSAATYYIKVVKRTGGASDFDFTVAADSGTIATLPLPKSTVLINDDKVIPAAGPFAASPFPATAWQLDGTFLGFVPGIPAGETGNALPNGIALIHSGVSGGNALTLYDASQASLGAVSVSGVAIGTSFPSIVNDGTQFVVLARPSNNVYTVSDAGVVAGPVATLSGTINGIGVSRDGTILYYAKVTDPVIYRHDLNTDTPLSDLYTQAYTFPNIAYTPNGHPGEILVLPDGSIVTYYLEEVSEFKAGILHISAAGALIDTYEWDANLGTATLVDHLDYDADLDSTAVNAWQLVDTSPGVRIARIGRFVLSTGTFSETFDHTMFAGGVASITVPDMFGPSSSCFMTTWGYGGTGTIDVTKATVPAASPQSFDFAAGGGLSPTAFDLLDGETQTFTDVAAGDGYTISESPVTGWSVSYTVSNGSSPDNIAVASGETVTVTVTNTQTPDPIPPPDGNDCCATNGPGGGDGPGGYPPPGSDGTPTTPRVVPPGGAPPAYITCNAGGGLPAFAGDPADLSDLTTCTIPRVYLQWRLRDGSVRRWGQFDFTSNHGPVTARVKKWGPVSQVLADRFGSFQVNHFTLQLSDADRAIRTLLTTGSTKYIDGTEIEILIEADGGAPRVLARAVVSDYSFNADLTVDLTCTDPLGYKYSSVSLDRPIPRRTFRRELFPALPEESSGKPVPIIYGVYSDDYTWLLNPNRIPVGILPIYYVGAPSSIPGLEGAPGDHAFAIGGHALSCTQSVFASNLGKDVDGVTDVPYGSVRMPTSLLGVEFFAPGFGLPLYHDLAGTDGITERYSFMTVKEGPRVRDHLNGRVPITMNVMGIEDAGDGSGNTITSLTYQFLHFLCQWVLQDYRTGGWLPVPTFADGTPKVRTSSFQSVVAIQTARMGEPYNGSLYLGEHKSGREWNTVWQVSGDMRHGVNHQGQSLVTTLNDTGSTGTLTTFTDTDDVLDASFTVEPKPEEIANIFTYQAGPEAATKRVAVVAKTIRNPTSIANHDDREAQALTYEATRHPPTADDVANRTLVRTADAPTEVSFATNLKAAALRLGQLIRIKHYQGIGAFGWTNRVLLVTGVRTMPDADQFSCEVDCEDVHDILAAGEQVMTVDVGLIDEARIA